MSTPDAQEPEAVNDAQEVSQERVDAAPTPPANPTSPPTAVEPPSPDVAPVGAESALPGAHRGGFSRLPTAPVELMMASAPAEPGTADDAPLLAWTPPEPSPHRALAPWALGFSITGLVFSFFVGWGFPLGFVGIVSAILALRHPLESRRMAVWALVLGVLSLVYSAIWLYYAWTRTQLSG